MTIEHNMDHLNHIEAVAASDCTVLRDKEATYQGSWKRAGGRSAWFMARRNIDRLLTMMGKPVMPIVFNLANVDDTIKAVEHGRYTKSGDDAEWAARLPGSVSATVDILKFLRSSYIADDIFAKIEERPGGEDGTVLAVIRDLRRYLILVEAEMVSRGVVQHERETAASYQSPRHDVYQLIADEKGIPRHEVKDRIHALFYDNYKPELPQLKYVKPVTVTIEVKQLDRVQGYQYTFPNAESVVITPNSDSLFISLDMGMHEPVAMPFGREAGGMSERRVPRQVPETQSRTPEAGSHHSSLFPWEVAGDAANALRARIGDELFNMFYNQRGPGHYRLEPVVVSHNMPKELANAYTLISSPPFTIWLLKRSQIPADLQDEYPRLQIEMNLFEYEQSSTDFKFMYHPVAEKMILQQCYMEWAVQS
jgi:hypothetical protein